MPVGGVYKIQAINIHSSALGEYILHKKKKSQKKVNVSKKCNQDKILYDTLETIGEKTGC